MRISIRQASNQDAEAIAQLNTACMGYDYPIADTAVNLTRILESPCDKVFVAVADAKIVGYIHVNDYRLLYAPAMINVMGIAVSDSCRRCGIGRQLLAAAEAWAQERGATAIRLVSGANRTEAHSFYRNCGFDGSREQLNFKKSIIFQLCSGDAAGDS